jgi:hypothetical protein
MHQTGVDPVTSGCVQGDYAKVLNEALRVREKHDGILPREVTRSSFWILGMKGLQELQPPSALDEENVQSLFVGGRKAPMVNALAHENCTLLLWHLRRHADALKLCIEYIGCVQGRHVGPFDVSYPCSLNQGIGLSEKLQMGDAFTQRTCTKAARVPCTVRAPHRHTHTHTHTDRHTQTHIYAQASMLSHQKTPDATKQHCVRCCVCVRARAHEQLLNADETGQIVRCSIGYCLPMRDQVLLARTVTRRANLRVLLVWTPCVDHRFT